MTSSQAIVPYPPTPAQLDAVLGDVYYEIQQLFMTSHFGANDQSVRNAFIESALLHVRVLLDFFEASRRSVDRRQSPHRENDDVLTLDFGFTPRPIAVDSGYRERLNKDLVHLTYSRATRLPQSREWPHRPVVLPVLRRAIEFLEFLGAVRRDRAKNVAAAEWNQLLDALKTYERAHSEMNGRGDG